MRHIQVCEHCGANKIVYKRTIRPQQIRQLYSLAKHGKSAKLASIPGVNPNSYPDFSRLRYWGLIAEDENYKHHWYVTDQGVAFLLGQIDIPKNVWIYRNEVVPPPNPNEPRVNLLVTEFENKEISKALIMEDAMSYREYYEHRTGQSAPDLFIR